VAENKYFLLNFDHHVLEQFSQRFKGYRCKSEITLMEVPLKLPFPSL